MILALSGSGVSDGIALGQLHVLSRGELQLPEYHLESDEVETEVERLRAAIEAATAVLAETERQLDDETRDSTGELLQVHRLMLRDSSLTGAAEQVIRDARVNAEWALDRQAAELRRRFSRLDDAYIALRVEDLDQVVRLLQSRLADQPERVLDARVPHRLDDTVVLAADLSPAELAALHQRDVAGLITEHGSVWSHAAIVARALNIPMVMAVHRAQRLLREGEPVILDSHYGIVLATRDERLHGHYAEKQSAARQSRRNLERYLTVPACTRDGLRFHLFCNADLAPEIRRCRELGAGGVGLMRSEFVFTFDELNDEDAQYRIYREAVELLDGRPLTIRTLDAGADKLPDDLKRLSGPNPALGLRGIRMSLAMQESFRVQLRAMLRASCHGPVRILLPMISQVAEIRRARELIVQCREQLRGEGVRADPEIPIGGMIETPAAALMTAQFARELDFVSIGSNDLVQYLLAVDRQDELVSHLFEPASRAVIETLATIVTGAARAGRPVQICGELAGDPRFSGLLIGLGITQFSLPPGQLAAVKSTLVKLDAAACRETMQAFLNDPEAEAGAALLDQLGPSG
ncbi:MAG: phosphoenolpyruvate--protein phosphotransferase [Wenzhouxiangellaceae bacterium]|nr:phosphoenolpyruvate--protein phosphotransferase [Wenzhouxiangellaceae bacterium]